MKNKFEIVEDHFSFCVLKINGCTVGRYCYDDAIDVSYFIYSMKQKMEARTGNHPEISFKDGMLTLKTYLYEFSFSVGALMLKEVQNSLEQQLDTYLTEYKNQHLACQGVVTTTEGTRLVFHGGSR